MPVELTDSDRVRLLLPPPPEAGPVDLVLDTDTYNEIDDQFALAYALLSTDRVRLRAVYAAPFHNARSSGPQDGMLRSHQEILRVLDRLGTAPDCPVFEGSRSWLPAPDRPVENPAMADLIDRVRRRLGRDRNDPRSADSLYVVAIGAPTNVASALLSAPDIAEGIVVVWLGGNPSYWQPGADFNAFQDLHASRVLLDSGVALVRVPCVNVTEHLRTTPAEVDRLVRPAGPLGAYLAEIFDEYIADHLRGSGHPQEPFTAASKELWDVGAVGWVIDPDWAPSVLSPSPLLNADRTWSLDPARHLIREVRTVRRDRMFTDLFGKLYRHATAPGTQPGTQPDAGPGA